jgi:hypothetical protein
MGGRAGEFIDASGVRVLGDASALGRLASTGQRTEVDERRQIPSEVAVAALRAVIDSACEPVSDEVVSTQVLARELWSRIKTDGRARWANRSFRAP